MKTTLGLWMGIGALAMVTGCAATPEEASASSENAIVGVTDLAELEHTLGLGGNASTPGAMDDATLRKGRCYLALMTGGQEQTHELRRYANGAAFFAKEGHGIDDGPKRPVVCVDLATGPAAPISLSGVVLDAFLRYDLGAIKSIQSLPFTQDYTIETERGALRLAELITDDDTASITKRPYEVPVGAPASAAGRLESILVKGVKRLYVGGMIEPKPGDLSIDGVAAQFIYRFAVMHAENGGAHSMADDRVGKFLRDEASVEGGMGRDDASFWFENGIQFYQKRLLGERITETFEVKHAEGGTRPYAECTGTRGFDGGPGTFECTGI